LFIEPTRHRAETIRKLAESRKNPEAVVHVRTGDCNPILPEFLAAFDPARSRGLAFLDPFGMQLTWDTLSTIAGVSGLAVWYWFSLEGVLRQAPRSRAKMTPDKQASLERWPRPDPPSVRVLPVWFPMGAAPKRC
jgi:three-Cys-motif partner protein